MALPTPPPQAPPNTNRLPPAIDPERRLRMNAATGRAPQDNEPDEALALRLSPSSWRFDGERSRFAGSAVGSVNRLLTLLQSFQVRVIPLMTAGPSPNMAA